MVFADLTFGLFRALVAFYTLITLPLYFLVKCCSRPLNAQTGTPKAEVVKRSPGEVTFRTTLEPGDLTMELIQAKIRDLAALFRFIVDKHGDKKALGWRHVIREEKEEQSGSDKVQSL